MPTFALEVDVAEGMFTVAVDAVPVLEEERSIPSEVVVPTLGCVVLITAFVPAVV